MGLKSFFTQSNDGAKIDLRWYEKQGFKPDSATVYAHGGGMMILSDVDKCDPVVSAYVAATQVPFFSVNYRLAPESHGRMLAEDTFANPLGLNYAEIQPGSYGPPSTGLSGYANPGSAGGTEVIRENLFMGTDTLLIQHGKNTISLGADVRYDPVYMYEDWQGSNLYFNGNYTGDTVAMRWLALRPQRQSA